MNQQPRFAPNHQHPESISVDSISQSSPLYSINSQGIIQNIPMSAHSNEKNNQNGRNEEELISGCSETIKEERKKLQNYQIKQKIGSGQFGKVYRTLYLPQKRQLAIKIIRFDEYDGHYLQQAQNYCKRETEISQKIIHSSLLPETFATMLTPQYCCIVNEYIFGFPLSSIIYLQTKLNSQTIKFYLASLLLAIEECHTQLHIIHRDIKPQNIIITHNGQLRLLDFGCSRFLAPNQRASSLVGTSDYFSNEVFKQDYGYDCDIWAFGVLAYELATYEFPFSYPSNFSSQDEKLFLLAKLIRNRKKIKLTIEGGDLSTMIEGILNTNESQRIEKWNINALKSQPYFEDVDWGQLKEGRAESPLEFSYEQVLNYQRLYQNQFDDF